MQSVLVMSYRMLSLTRSTHNSTNGVSDHQGLMLLYSRGDINQINSCLKTAFPSLLGIKQ